MIFEFIGVPAAGKTTKIREMMELNNDIFYQYGSINVNYSLNYILMYMIITLLHLPILFLIFPLSENKKIIPNIKYFFYHCKVCSYIYVSSKEHVTYVVDQGVYQSLASLMLDLKINKSFRVYIISLFTFLYSKFFNIVTIHLLIDLNDSIIRLKSRKSYTTRFDYYECSEVEDKLKKYSELLSCVSRNLPNSITFDCLVPAKHILYKLNLIGNSGCVK